MARKRKRYGVSSLWRREHDFGFLPAVYAVVVIVQHFWHIKIAAKW